MTVDIIGFLNYDIVMQCIDFKDILPISSNAYYGVFKTFDLLLPINTLSL